MAGIYESELAGHQVSDHLLGRSGTFRNQLSHGVGQHSLQLGKSSYLRRHAL
jgi:hypothetical protein